MSDIRAVYRLTCDVDDVGQLSRDIAVEQTVEVPESLISSHGIRDEFIGRVEKIEPTQPAPGVANSFDVTIAYRSELSAYSIGQTLNLVYGNISLKRNIRLVDLAFPDDFLGRFRGPNFGVDGIRQILGLYGRPLLATALKPKGSPVEKLAAIAREFAAGGGDLIKDDHNLTEQSFDDFRRRVECCQQATIEGSRLSGHATLYFPNISAPVGDLEKQIEFALQIGIRGILISPLLVGLDYVRHLTSEYPLAVMAHPTFSGTFFHDSQHGIDPGLMLGCLFRLIGCDFSIYPNFGGRFTFSEAECHGIADALRAPIGTLRAAFPVPAGGMRYETIPAMAEQYGADSVFLIGGALLEHSDSLRGSTQKFLECIRQHFAERRTTPQEPAGSACELPPSTSHAPATQTAARLLDHLIFRPDFRWDGREPTVYKAAASNAGLAASTNELPFRDVTRIELVGKSGEQTAFDVRYFEIAPGGFSSLEKHVHTHVVIGVRGEGILISGDDRVMLKQFDVAYVPSLRVHQLRNETDQPFGFFCIVDHERDRPTSP